MAPDSDLDPALLDALRAVIDPELGIDIVDLGLVYSAKRTDTSASVTMTMTSPACPVGPYLTGEAERVLRERFPGLAVDVELVLEPFWTPDRLSESARQTLGWPE